MSASIPPASKPARSAPSGWELRGQSLRKACVRAVLRAFGWRLVGESPEVRRCVVIFAPHTSNWDFPLLLLVRIALGRKVVYLAKHTLFRFPIGWLFRCTGGVAVERSEHHHLVQQLVRLLDSRSELWLALSPEGTRARTKYWRTGFYHVAQKAGVPVLLAFVDSKRKECGVGPLIELTGDTEHDMGAIADFYRGKRGVVPERFGEIRLHPEEP